MNSSQGPSGSAPTYAAVLRVPRYLPVFLANALSMWGDYIARVTIAAVVYAATGDALATATTLAVSLVPTFFGRSLVGPIVDRLPYKWVLIWSHLLRAACVLALMYMVLADWPLWSLFTVLFVLELIGGASTASYMVLVTDLFEDRSMYARAVGLGAMSEQFNQAIGLALGGGLIALVGPETGLLFDLVTFVIAALVILFVVELRPVSGERGRGLRGFVRDLSTAAGDLARHPVLARLVALSAVACLGIAAPEALAIPIAGQNGWGGVLMAAPIVGAVVGILLIGRRDVHQQNRSIVPLALAMPLPLLLTAPPPADLGRCRPVLRVRHAPGVHGAAAGDLRPGHRARSCGAASSAWPGPSRSPRRARPTWRPAGSASTPTSTSASRSARPCASG